jgi:hypothetical protein
VDQLPALPDQIRGLQSGMLSVCRIFFLVHRFASILILYRGVY